METDENENSCGKIEANGKQDCALVETTESSAPVFEEIKLNNEHISLDINREALPEIDINDDKSRRLEDFELHRKLMEEQVKSCQNQI